MDPANWSLRGLLDAYAFKNKRDWQHTSLICAVIEVHAGMGGRKTVSPRKSDMSSPLLTSGSMRLTSDRIDNAAQMFCGKDAPEYVIDSQTGAMRRVS